MQDDVKTLRERIDRAIQRITDGHGAMRVPADMTDPDIVLDACRRHIDAEPERLAAAVATAREEQREADVRSCPTCKGEGFTMRVRECPFCSDSTHDHECPTDEVKVYCACGAAHIRATPLTATPLADELERTWNTTAKHVDERDAALARVKELARERDFWKATASMHESLRAETLKANHNLQARAEELKTALHFEREAHGRALREALDPVVRAKMMEPPPPLLLSPDVAALMSERDALKAQLAEAMGVLRYLVEFIAAGGTPDDEDLAKARAFLAKYPEGR